jgi:tetratricopeptide (TPR) repeat protein
MEGRYSIRVGILCSPRFNQFNTFGDERNIQVIELCDEAIEKDPELVDAYVFKRKCLFSVRLEAKYKSRRNEMEASFHELPELAYRLDLKSPDAVSNHRNSLNMKGDYDQRMKYAKEALELNPSHPRSNSQYGMASCNEVRFAEAEKFFLRAIELDPV